MGHIDTVPGVIPVMWEGDVLHGRGAVDAKGPLVAHALALSRLLEAGEVRCSLVGAVGEEAESRGARALVERVDAPDALVIAEPTGLETVGLGYKGCVKGVVEAKAVPSHPGEPSLTASELVLDGLDALGGFVGNQARAVGFEEETLRVMELASDRGAREETARAVIDVRVPGAPPSEGSLRGALPEGCSLRVVESLPGVRADPRNPLATGLRGALREAGIEVGASVKTGTSDWNVVSQAWSCPGVAYGPGDASLDHTPHERVSLGDVVMAGEVLARGIQRAACVMKGETRG